MSGGLADGNVEIRSRPAGDGRCHVVTFDHYHDEHHFDRFAFGERFLGERGIAATHVLTRGNDWFQYRDIDAILAAVRATIPAGATVLAYGSSMGGYAAIRFADAIGAARVLAISPQYSIAPTVMPDEPRWRTDRRRIRFLAGLNGPIRCTADVVVAYDPRGDDLAHVRRIVGDVAVRELRVPHAGHPAGGFLGETGLLAEMVLAALEGRLDCAALAMEARAARGRSMHYVANLAGAQSAARPRTRLGLLQKAVALQPSSPVPHHRIAEEMRALGRLDEAIAAHLRAIAIERAPCYLQGLAETLLQAGDATAAIALGEEMRAQSPTFAPALHLIARAHLALGKPRAALRAMTSALRITPRDKTCWKLARIAATASLLPRRVSVARSRPNGKPI